MEDAEAARRAAAEARRAKILARGTDRLARITGTATTPSEVPSTASNAIDAETSKQPVASIQADSKGPTSSSPAIQPASTAGQGESNQHAEALTAAKTQDSVPAPHADTAASMRMGSMPLLGNSTPASGSRTKTALEDDLRAALHAPQQASSSAIEPTDLVLMQAAVRSTQLMRLLLAMTLAHALVFGAVQFAQLPVRPIFLILITELALILGARVLLSSPGFRQALGVQLGSSQARSFNLMRILGMVLPQFKGPINQMAAAEEAVKGAGSGGAVFVVAYVVLHAVAHWGTPQQSM